MSVDYFHELKIGDKVLCKKDCGKGVRTKKTKIPMTRGKFYTLLSVTKNYWGIQGNDVYVFESDNPDYKFQVGTVDKKYYIYDYFFQPSETEMALFDLKIEKQRNDSN